MSNEGEKTFSEEEVKDEIKRLKTDLKIHATSARRPQMYTTDKDIKIFLEDFELYRQMVGITKEMAYKTFLTYLPDRQRLRLRTLKLSEEEMENWAEIQQIITDTLTHPTAKIKAKYELEGAKQKDDESVLDFLERLQLLVDQCYNKPEEEQFKEMIAKDMFVRGLKDDIVGIEVLTIRDEMSLKDLVDVAMKKELAVHARTLSKNLKGVEGTVSVLAVTEPPVVDEGPTKSSGKANEIIRRERNQCYECGSSEHYVKVCPFRTRPSGNRKRAVQRNHRPSGLRCWTCGGPHLQRNCTHRRRNTMGYRGRNQSPQRMNQGNRRVWFSDKPPMIKTIPGRQKDFQQPGPSRNNRTIFPRPSNDSRRNFQEAQPTYRVNSIMTQEEQVEEDEETDYIFKTINEMTLDEDLN